MLCLIPAFCNNKTLITSASTPAPFGEIYFYYLEVPFAFRLTRRFRYQRNLWNYSLGTNASLTLHLHLHLQLLFSVAATIEKPSHETIFLTLGSASWTKTHLTKYSLRMCLSLTRFISEQIGE